MRDGTRRRHERDIVLPAEGAAVFDFEDFADGLAFLQPLDRRRIKVAGSEILDNIVKHASPLEGGKLRIRASLRDDSILLAFYFRSPGFAAFARGEAVKDESSEAPGRREPLFDPTRRRWRGIGLVMCRNIARRLTFRPGTLVDRIFLEF